jgi:hypothetical protein
VVTPKLVRSRDFTRESLQMLSVGTDSEMAVHLKENALEPVAVNEQQRAIMGARTVVASPDNAMEKPPALRLEPSTLSIKTGETGAIRVRVENIEDLFSASLLFRYDPQLLAVDDVQHGDFLSGGTQEVAIVQRINKDKGQAGIFTTRQPNTAGINGTGVLLTLMVKRLADGPASLQVMEAGSRNSRQKLLPVKIVQGSVTIP